MNQVIRCQPTTELRLRSEGNGRKAVGYAAVFNEWTTLSKGDGYRIREIIKPGSFRHALAERQDVRALWNHDPKQLLGRTAAGTLRLSEDSRGLRVEIDLPDTATGRDVAELIARGDATQMSMAFLPREGGESVKRRSEGGIDVTETTITDADLFDVSIVTYPAYQSTRVELRGGAAEGDGLREGLTDRERRAVDLAKALARYRAVGAKIAAKTAGVGS